MRCAGGARAGAGSGCALRGGESGGGVLEGVEGVDAADVGVAL